MKNIYGNFGACAVCTRPFLLKTGPGDDAKGWSADGSSPVRLQLIGQKLVADGSSPARLQLIDQKLVPDGSSPARLQLIDQKLVADGSSPTRLQLIGQKLMDPVLQDCSS